MAGIDVVKHPGEVRHHIGVAAQDATLDPLLTGRQNLVLVGELSDMGRSDSRARAAELLDAVRADRCRRPGGEGLLGRHAAAPGPGGLVDDPAAGSVPRRADDRARPGEPPAGVGRHPGLIDEGVTVLLTTQYLDEADALAHRIVVVDHGLVIADGTPQELKEASRSAHVEVTLAAAHAAAVGAIAPLVAGTGARDRRRTAALGRRRRLSGSGDGGGACAWMPRVCSWTTSRCASLRWTTCSSR